MRRLGLASGGVAARTSGCDDGRSAVSGGRGGGELYERCSWSKITFFYHCILLHEWIISRCVVISRPEPVHAYLYNNTFFIDIHCVILG